MAWRRVGSLVGWRTCAYAQGKADCTIPLPSLRGRADGFAVRCVFNAFISERFSSLISCLEAVKQLTPKVNEQVSVGQALTLRLQRAVS